MEHELVCIKKACELAGVSRRAIYDWLAAGKLKHVKTAGGQIRIVASTLFRPSEGFPQKQDDSDTTKHKSAH